MKIQNFKICDIVNPVGVDEKRVTFAWQIAGSENNLFQESYRIVVALSSDLSSDIVWDSKKVKSDKTYDIEYKGAPLTAHTKYYCQVTATVNGKEIKSQIATFITGILKGEIEGKWLSVYPRGANVPESTPYVRKTFSCKEVDYATLSIFSYGWYEAYLNGRKLDDRLYAANKSKYTRTFFYDSYDITEHLGKGDNALGLILGDGYNSNANKYLGPWKGGKRFIATINFHFKDGSTEQIKTDESWKFTLDTPIITNNIYNGELYDATRELDGWNEVGFDDSGWKALYVVDMDRGRKFHGDIGPFIKVAEEVKPKKIHTLKDGRYILDFGQNFAGVVKLSLSKSRGERVRIRTAEEIGRFDGEYFLDTFTNRFAAATDTYIFKGKGVETYCPRFTYHGFRYAEISGLDHKPKGNEVVACVIHNEFSHLAPFKTDNELINRIYLNALWSVRSNTYSYPTDCASRDERTPCSMDLYTYINTLMYMVEPNRVYERFIKMQIVMEKIKGKRSINMTWSGCLPAIPYYFYKYYGNLSIVKTHYAQLKEAQNFYLSQYKDLVPKGGFGDWCAPNKPGNYDTSFSACEETEQHAMYFTCKMMSEMAAAIGKTKDAEYYADCAEKCGEIYKKRFYNSRKKLFSDGKQAPNIYALHDGILTEKERATVGKALVNEITSKGNQLDLGIYGIRNFVEVLSDLGAIDTALDCFMNPEYPSFAHQISKGATTLWEQWCGFGDMASHNHAMFAGAVSGFFTRLAGITPKETAFRTVQIKPVLSKHINNLSTAVQTVNGRLEVAYKKENADFELIAVIPPNCKGEIVMPNGETHSVGNGKYIFTCKT